LYPLPPNYYELTSKLQKEARLNAVHLQETPEDLVWAWMFFRNWYLRQTPPGFFYKRFKESPPFHYQIIRDVGQYPLNAVAAPRGGAKSTVLGVELPLLLALTRPYFTTLLVFSKETMVSKRMNTQIFRQIGRNPFILEDFGNMMPKKGVGARSVHLLELTNGAVIEAASVKGSNLGARPDLCLIDDPEIDPKLNKVTPELRENYADLLFHHILPMIDEDESALYWIGTLLSKQCLLYEVVTGTTDERFEFFNRRLLDAEDNGHGKLLWPEKWHDDFLARERIKLGMAAYNAQRRNKPGELDEQVLKIHPTLCQYDIANEDLAYATDPLSSNCILRTHARIESGKQAEQVIERPFGTTVSGMMRILTMDWAQCLTPLSDYIAMAVVGVENSKDFRMTWWLLDLYVGRLQGEAWVRQFWSMAMKWKVRYAGVEAVAAQETLVNTAAEYCERMAGQHGWIPRVVPIKYPHGLGKEERIGSLEWRYNTYRMKYPKHLKHKAAWRELWAETEGFTGMEGATQHDDAIDAVAMVQNFTKGGGRRIVEPDMPHRSMLDHLRAGDYTVGGGLQPIMGINAEDLTIDVVNDAMAAIQDDYDEQTLGYDRPGGRIMVPR